MKRAPFETFAALENLRGVRHAFLQRVPGVDVAADRETALARLESVHRDTIAALGLADRHLVVAEQVHGNRVVVVDGKTEVPVPQADGLITRDPGVVLGIYVADCGPVYFADPVARVIGLCHSGRKGTELEIAVRTIERMGEAFGSKSEDIVAVLGPCIRPPYYEVDFAAAIGRQCREAGVGTYFDGGACTFADPERYYSYRRELGKTGRLLAVLALTE